MYDSYRSFKLPQTKCFWLLRNVLVTNYDVTSYILGRHDLSEAIFKMLAVKNGQKPNLGISKLGFYFSWINNTYL